jgi:hypothetical protein
MSTQANLANQITSVIPDAVVKKVDKDNFLDIHIPSVNEKKGTHLFFNTGKEKIKMGFYCRDKDWVDALLQKDSNRGGGNNATLEEYSQGIRPFNNPEFESVDDAIACALLFIANIGGPKATISKSVDTNEPIEVDDELGYPLLSYKNSDQNKEYVKRYLRPTKTLNGRMGVKMVIPDWVEVLLDDCVCFDFPPEDIAIIREGIESNKVIPILKYDFNIKGSNLTDVKNMWWIVPFAFWNNTISWLAINKDGLYAPYNDNNDATLILSWDRVQDISFSNYYEPFGVEEPDSKMNLLTIMLEGGNELEISEFLEDGRGSYLSVLHDIYWVRQETIEASKGLQMWKEGAGGEGFRSFPESVELAHLPYWSDSDVHRPSFEPDAQEETNAPKNSYDVKEEFVMPICKLIKMYLILPHFPFIVNALHEEGYTLATKNCWFYAQDIHWAGKDESWNLLIDHNGFYSSMGEKEFKLLFNWDDVAEIKTRVAEDQSGVTIGLFQADGQNLTLTQSGSMSLLIVYWLYQKIVCDIIENFKDQATIHWSFVENELGVQLNSFNSYEEFYDVIPPELMD